MESEAHPGDHRGEPAAGSATTAPGAAALDGLVVVLKQDCPTCRLVAPVLAGLSSRTTRLTVLLQDDPSEAGPAERWLSGELSIEHDSDLLLSHRLGIEVVPTLLRLDGGREEARSIGWHREQWREITGDPQLGIDLPPARPGCGARNVEPAHAERLARLAGTTPALQSRPVELGESEDPFEACFARGWTDGLPVVPPEPVRVARMLAGTSRSPDEVVGVVAPDLVPCTVEKVAVNAVMAGCLPEYLPVVLACVEAACAEEFNWHGLAATTYFSGPVVVVNGPARRRLGMNSGMNVLGQGNRANSTIGRALQLTLRNVGGARPGQVDRCTLGNPGKLSFCFAEDEEGSPWESLAIERGVPPGSSAVTLFAGEGPRGIVDQQSRAPESLARSLAMALRSVAHPKLVLGFDAVVIVSPEHGRVFREAGWSKARLRQELHTILTLPVAELLRGAGGCAEGLPPASFPKPEGVKVPKFRPDGLLFVHAGGRAGLFSAIVGGWINGAGGSQPVTRVVRDS